MPNHNLLSSTVKALQPRSLKYLSASLQGLIRGKLWLQVLVGMFLGIVVGILMGPSLGWVSPADAAAISDWLALPGKLFLALIQMIVIPLVFASIIRGLAATEDLEQLKKTGFRVVLYFIVTTAIAIVIGITIANLIKPGQYVDQQALQLVAQFSVMKTGFASHSPASFHSLHEQVSGVQRSGSGAEGSGDICPTDISAALRRPPPASAAAT